MLDDVLQQALRETQGVEAAESEEEDEEDEDETEDEDDDDEGAIYLEIT